MKPVKPKPLAGIAFLALAVALTIPTTVHNARAAQPGVPRFEPDPYWPKPLPNNWMLGQVSGIYVDSHDHIWVTSRPRTLDNNDKYAALNPPQADCCIPAPPIIEFDQAGNFIQGWGGPGQGYEWPDNEHGIFIDYKENVWVGGNSDKDTNILKFTKTGKFLLQIGHHGKSGGSNDIENLKRPAGICVYPKTNEVFVADGYGNRRVIVFDADTGAYKRHWGAYGNKPDDNAPRTRVYDGPGPQQFNTVHGIRISNDDLVYVGDRVNNRIQVFRPDGTFVKEGFIERKTSTPEGTAFDIAFSRDKQQQFLYVPDGSNKKVQILNRDTLEVLGFFGGHGGHGTGQFFHIHSIASDSKGNIYLGESFGMRALRWNYKGMSSASTR
jgi:DNA-binding beta-propeller fold protein YncE